MTEDVAPSVRLAKVVSITIPDSAETEKGPYLLALVDLRPDRLLCSGDVRFLPPGTNVEATIRVPGFLGAGRLRLPGTVESCEVHDQKTLIALSLASLPERTNRRLIRYLSRADHAYHELVQRQGAPSQLAESFRMLQIGLGPARTDKRPRSILVTSSVQGEGKSFTASNLAVQLGSAGNRVLLADLDLRQPSQHKIFGTAGGPGVTEWVSDSGGRLAELIVSTDFPVDVLPAGGLGASPLWHSSHVVTSVLEGLAQTDYQFLILDSEPVLLSATTRKLSSVVDEVLVVVRSGVCRERDLRETLSILKRVGARVSGVVMNDVVEYFDSRQNGYFSQSSGKRRLPLRFSRGRESDPSWNSLETAPDLRVWLRRDSTKR
jgi:Mrp family chromosome partitioning ATPase